jgi:stalled ribosome rescue protein Dom34
MERIIKYNKMISKIPHKKYVGIWMDNAHAHLIHIDAESENHSLTSKFTADVKEEALNKSEKGMHHKEQQMQASYYKEIAGEILKYTNVLLFGPTNAKEELRNFLSKDVQFKYIKIDVLAADKMTDNQQIAFVKKHYRSTTTSL